jgi:hypothetical protein
MAKIGSKVLWSGDPAQVGWITAEDEDTFTVYFQGASDRWGKAIEFPGSWTVVN